MCSDGNIGCKFWVLADTIGKKPAISDIHHTICWVIPKNLLKSVASVFVAIGLMSSLDNLYHKNFVSVC